MKLTVSQLRKIIKEEVARTLRLTEGSVTFIGNDEDLKKFKSDLDRLEDQAVRGKGTSHGVAEPVEAGKLVVNGNEDALKAAKDLAEEKHKKIRLG